MKATVVVDGKQFTGTVYHVRDNGWLNVETPEGVIASGPAARTVKAAANAPVIVGTTRVYRGAYHWFVERYTDGPDDGQLLACRDSKEVAVRWAEQFEAGEIES